AEGLVRLDRDLDRDDDRRARLLFVYGAHRDGDRAVVPQPRSLEGRQLRSRNDPDVPRRHSAVWDDGLVADDAAGSVELPGDDDWARDRAARHRHDGRDVYGRPPGGPHRHTADHHRRARADRRLDVADDRFLALYGHGPGDLDRAAAR